MKIIADVPKDKQLALSNHYAGLSVVCARCSSVFVLDKTDRIRTGADTEERFVPGVSGLIKWFVLSIKHFRKIRYHFVCCPVCDAHNKVSDDTYGQWFEVVITGTDH